MPVRIRISRYRLDSAGQRRWNLAAATDFRAGLTPGLLTVGDFNGDGKLDLAVAAISSSVVQAVSILVGDGDGYFQLLPSFSIGAIRPAGLAAADFNGDDKLDLAACGQCSPRSE